MKISKVEIEGFRAYKFSGDGVFDFTLDDGVTPSNFAAIYAPNGFGKSSFYDAVEWAFTGSLERYTAEHNKKNNQIAARGTKQDQIPLKILRNKDVPDHVETRVNVITTCGTFPRSLPKLRSNSIDLDMKSAKSRGKKEGNGFEKIILSQDAIDRFLREAKPQERYDRFMEYFGGEAEALRKEITAVLTENKMTLEDLKKQQRDIKKLLKIPSDPKIFEKFNAQVESLNLDGENISFVSNAFDTAAEYQLVSAINERKHELFATYNVERQKEISLAEQISRLEEFQMHLGVIAEQGPRLKAITKGVLDSQRYSDLSAAYDRHQIEWKKATAQLGELCTVEGYVPDFLIDESFRKNTALDRDLLSRKKAELEIKLQAALSSVKELQNTSENTAKRVLALRAMLAGSPAVYGELAAQQGGLQLLKLKLQKSLNLIKVDQGVRARITMNLNKLTSLLVNVDALKGPDSVLFEITLEALQNMYSAQQELEQLEMHGTLIGTNQLALSRQKQVIEKLMSIGLDYLVHWPTDNCPLCRKKHPSLDDLTSAIRENDLLTEVEKQNAIKLEEITTRTKKLKDIISSVLTLVESQRSQKIVDFNTQLSVVSSRIESAEQDCHNVAIKINAIEQSIQALQQRVWNVSSDELKVLVGNELNSLSIVGTTQQKKLAEANKRFIDSEREMLDINSRLGSLNLELQKISEKNQYKIVVEFALDEMVGDYGLLQKHCMQKRFTLERSIQETSTQMEFVSTQCKELQKTMLDDGNWIDFKLLASHKEEASRYIGDASFFVESFVGSLTKLMGENVEPNTDLIKQKIESAIQASVDFNANLLSKIDRFEKLTVQLESFKPYMDSLALREKNNKVEAKIQEHQLVDANLSADRELIFTELRERIGSFFYSDLINAIYSKIDPHPSFKEVAFIPDFESVQPGLNIVLKDNFGGLISPILYFSAAQLNILSLSVFLANALHATDDKNNPLDVILIDDPIQSMDSINVLAVIDLLRNISLRFNKQIIISTHDENFFELLKLKIPSETFGSKFLQLESFGIVSRVQSARDFVTGRPKTSPIVDGNVEE
ncbi:AAA family ATPase [Pseudomonas poae]|uniref:AAA family ATPase n=1 Tax=Pseudomonas poae TaxID=200451 RepID=UPI0034D48BB2